MSPLLLLAVAVGAALGGCTRHVVTRRLGQTDRRGTTAANVVGSLLLAVVTGAGLDPLLTAALGAGLCGALTTWSTLARGVADDLLARRYGAALVYLCANLALGIGAAWCGWTLTHG